MKKILEQGDRFGDIIVLNKSYIHGKNRKYECMCILCGTIDYFFGNNLKKGNTSRCKSCAGKILSQKILSGEIPAPGGNKTGAINGMSTTPQYNAYKTMVNRCYNPNHIQYKDYGGRGIKVCDRWRYSYLNFYEDMGPRPDGMSLDRIDVDGDYCPENCKWSSTKEQGRNRRDTIYLTYKNETKPMAEWAEILGVKYGYLAKRRKSNKDMEKVISELINKE